MTGHILELRDCTPEPLVNYLKGLGVFRLIAEHADLWARAWWKDGVLFLQIKWSSDALIEFFLCGIGESITPIYRPSPIFAPWGGRPGFYSDGNEKAKNRLQALRELNVREGSGVPERVTRARHGFHTALRMLVERDAHHSDELLDVVVSASRIEREASRLEDREKILTPCPAPLSQKGAR